MIERNRVLAMGCHIAVNFQRKVIFQIPYSKSRGQKIFTIIGAKYSAWRCQAERSDLDFEVKFCRRLSCWLDDDFPLVHAGRRFGASMYQ